MLPSLKEQLSAHKVRADKRFGQHFLLDQNVTDKIVRQAGKLAGVHVVEIGPGPGGLTRSLIDSPAASITAIEKDSRLLPLLEEVAKSDERLTIIQADALAISLIETVPAPRAVIANLPYNVGTAMLIKWLKEISQDTSNYESLTLMFQKEVVNRIVAQEGSKHYGRLSVLCQWLCEVTPCFELPAKAFTPPPKVDSSVVKLVPRAKRADCEIAKLEKVTAAAFGQRRKMLRSSLKSLHPQPEAWLEKCGIDPTLRAEVLTLTNFIDLACTLEP